MFCQIDGGLAVCSGSGVQVYDIGADGMFTETFNIASPPYAPTEDIGRYDLGGKLLKVFDLYGVIKSISTEQNHLSVTESKRLAGYVRPKPALQRARHRYDGDLDARFTGIPQKDISCRRLLLRITKPGRTDPDGRRQRLCFLLDADEKVLYITRGVGSRDQIFATADTRPVPRCASNRETGRQRGYHMRLFQHLAGYSLDGDSFILLALKIIW